MIIFMIILNIFVAGPALAKESVFYVSTTGNDSWSGRLAEPNKDKADGPFVSIERARDAIREMRGKEKGLKVPVNVTLRGGTYYLDKTLTFTSQDSGTKECPITYQAYKDEKPIISGGRIIKGWRPFTSTQGNLWSVKIPEVESGGWNFNQLFVNGERRTRARMPNRPSYFRIARASGKSGFQFNKGDIKEWENWEEAIIIFCHSWEASIHYISSIDTENCVVKLKPQSPWALGSSEKKQRYYVENVFEGLDSPGEWYLNRSTGTLYYYPAPGEDMEKAEVIAPVIKVTLVNFQGKPEKEEFIDYINIKGVSFQHANANISKRMRNSGQSACYQEAAIMAKGLRNSNFENCEIAHVGEHGIWLRAGCKDNRIFHCHIYDMGAGGVRIGEESSPANEFLASLRNTVDNNFIHDGCNVFHGAAAGVWIGRSSYNNVTHNEICDFDDLGISVGWNWTNEPTTAHDNIIEYNHVHHINNRILSDGGPIYTLGVSPGTRICYNLIHDCYPYSYGGWGIYFDAGSSEILAENNVVYNMKDGGFFNHCYSSPYKNIVRNNIFAFSENNQIGRAGNSEGEPFTVVVENNIIYSDKDIILKTGNWETHKKYIINNNCYWSSSKEDLSFLGMSFQEWQSKGHDQNSIVADPLFVDAKNYNFTLKPNSPVFKIGFKPIDMSKIGLYGEPEWVNAPKKVVHRPDEPLPPEFGAEPINDDFEITPVGEPPAGASVVVTAGKKASVKVTEETAAGGKHSLKFVDAPGLANVWEPHIFYNLNYKTGKIKFSCDVKNSSDEPADVLIEFRDWSKNPYSTGPIIFIHPDGNLVAGNQQISSVPLGEWVHIEINFKLGDDAPKTYELKLTLPKEKPQTLELSFASPDFAILTWFGLAGMGNEKGVFYVDNIKLEPVK